MKLMKNPFGLAGPILWYLTIAVSILVFVYSGLYRSLDILDSDAVETDFFHWYAAGELWNDGVNPYEYETYRARYERTVQGKQLRKGLHITTLPT